MSNIEKIEELKKKYREVEQQLQQSRYSVKLSKQKYKEDCGREVKDLMGELQTEKFHHGRLR